MGREFKIQVRVFLSSLDFGLAAFPTGVATSTIFLKAGIVRVNELVLQAA